MYLSARPRIILEKILSTKDNTVSGLASYLGVSERTIRRDLDSVKKTLAQFNLILIKKGGAVSISGSKKDRERLSKVLLRFIHNEYTPLERQRIILWQLLKANEPIKLIAFANILSVTVATVTRDLTRIEEEWRGKIRIIRKRGIGVQLKTTILENRELLRELIRASYPELTLYRYLKDPLEYREPHVPEALTAFIDFPLLSTADYSLNKWMKKLSYEISQTSSLNLLLYLLITLKQIKLGKKIYRHSKFPIFLQDYPEYDIAKRILNDCLSDEGIPEAEIMELTMQILSAEIHKGEEAFYRNEKVQAIRIAKKLISKVNQLIDTPLSEFTILKGLAKHIQHSLVRLKKKMPLTNPLLPLIKAEFGDLFAFIHREASLLYPFKHLPEAETGFIVLHFEAALLQSENARAYSALIITSGSNGVNMWLKARFRKKLPDLKKIKFITPLDMVKERTIEKYDIVLSATELENFPFEYQSISIFISDGEILNIQRQLENTMNTKKKLFAETENEEVKNLSETITCFKKMQHYYLASVQFLTSFHIEEINNMTRNIEDNFRFFSQSISKKNNYQFDAESLFKCLIGLQSKRKIILSGASVACFVVHTETEKPSIHIFRLKYSIEIHGENNLNAAISSVIIFNLPHHLDKIQLEIIGYLFTTLTEDEQVHLLLESGSKESITTLFIDQFQSFLQQKTF